jgi:hypothetical protein
VFEVAQSVEFLVLERPARGGLARPRNAGEALKRTREMRQKAGVESIHL